MNKKMSALRNYLNKIKPNFQKGGKLHAFESVFDGFESFLYVPNTTAKSGAHIHDAIDTGTYSHIEDIHTRSPHSRRH